MAISFSDHCGIDSVFLSDANIFDPILDTDTRLFLDPHLLKHTTIKEFAGSYSKMQEHFARISKLLIASEGNEASKFWKAADKLMSWHEVKGLCIGYSSKGTSGSGIGPGLRQRLLKFAMEILQKGKDDPELFELVGLFEEDFGQDRISDMTANIIRDDLRIFTKNILEELNFDVASKFSINEETGLPINPFNNEDICLIPKELLRDLPLVFEWSSMDKIAFETEEIRENLNKLIGDSWKQATTAVKKSVLRDCVLMYPSLFDDLVGMYSSKVAHPYDFRNDRSGEYLWYETTKQFTRDFPLDLKLSAMPSIEQVEEVVMKICEKFKELIENNGLCKLLYNKDGSPKNEEAAQLIFYGVSESYCVSNNIQIARECNSGRGPVDFKFGTYQENSVLVELKKSTNTSGLKKGIQKQLPEYMDSEKAKRGIYLIIDVGFTKAAIKNLEEINKMVNGKNVTIFHVDAIIKESASR